jgi:polyisoprenyl-teichoic acid--peptidoglycan teichoic acid transferase
VGTRRSKVRSPLWARLCLIFGILLLLVGGGGYAGATVLVNRVNGAVTQDDLLGDGNGAHGGNVTGPLDVLLAGSDLRQSWKSSGTMLPRTDTIMWLHIPKSLDQAYLLSIPRDLEADIPADPHSGFAGETTKINASFTFGLKNVNDVKGGMQLLTKTVEQVTGAHFDMAALVNWDGFRAIVSELGGVTLCLDKPIVNSTQLDPNGPPISFPAGCHHYDANRALLLVRQRDNYTDTDWGRQRMQQQFIKQILKKATSAGVLTNPTKINSVLDAAGKALTMDLNGYKPVDLALALHKITSSKIVTLQIPYHPLGDGNMGLVEPTCSQLFAAMRDDTMDDLLIKHPELVSHGSGTGG